MSNGRAETVTDVEQPPKEFFGQYLDFVSGTEVPPFFSRWAAIGALGAWIGRRAWLDFGGDPVYPNLYIMLLGEAGTKKSTAIRKAKKLLALAGYDNFAAEKTSKEKFLLDLAGVEDEEEDVLETPFGDDGDKEVLIAADEFNDFFGNNILEFVSMLGVLWDYSGQYKNRIKNGASIIINNPTVSILGGNTPITFANTFPPEVIGQGFFTRCIAVHAAPTGKRITKPRKPAESEIEFMVTYLQAIRSVMAGEIKMTVEADKLLDKIYKTWKDLEDIRFKNYSNRRLQHLLKLVLIHAAARLSPVVDSCDVLYANTILTHTEHFMPRAYGALGQAKSSLNAYKVLSIIEGAREPVSVSSMWDTLHGEFESLHQLGEVVQSLTQAGKIQAVDGKPLFLPKKRQLEERFDDMVNYNLLTDEERRNV